MASRVSPTASQNDLSQRREGRQDESALETPDSTTELPERATFSGPGPRKNLVTVIWPPTRVLFSLCRQVLLLQSLTGDRHSGFRLLTSSTPTPSRDIKAKPWLVCPGCAAAQL